MGSSGLHNFDVVLACCLFFDGSLHDAVQIRVETGTGGEVVGTPPHVVMAPLRRDKQLRPLEAAADVHHVLPTDVTIRCIL